LNTADRKRRRSKEKEQGRLHRLFFRGDLRVVLCNNFFSLGQSDVFCFRKILLDFWGSDREKKKKKKKLRKKRRRESSLLFFTENTHMIKHTFLFLSF